MTISDETIMAFADGELDSDDCAAVELAMRVDPVVAGKVAAQRALRQKISMAYAAELTEPVPERLLMSARRKPEPRTDNVVQMKDARAAMTRNTETRQGAAPAVSQAAHAALWWRPMGSIAASVIVGFGLGYGVLRHSASPVIQGSGGAVVANGDLSKALSEQLVADQGSTAAAKIGISFLAKSGDYCRTFSLSGPASPAGIACRHNGDWQIRSLDQTPRDAGATGDYRTAGTYLPPALLKSVEDQIVGEPLDKAAEAAARDHAWTVRH